MIFIIFGPSKGGPKPANRSWRKIQVEGFKNFYQPKAQNLKDKKGRTNYKLLANKQKKIIMSNVGLICINQVVTFCHKALEGLTV